MKIEFTVPTVPIAQPRQRHRVVTAGNRVFASNYTPESHPVNAFKAAAQLAAREAYKGPPLDEPLWCRFVFVVTRASKPAWIKRKSHPKWFERWSAGQRVPYRSPRNDRDNLMKSLQDALNQLVWADDGNIVAGPVEKWIAADDEPPHVEVVVQTL